MSLPLLPQGTLDYTGLARADMLVRLQKLFNQVNPEWDDFSPGFPENLLLEGMVFCADLVRGTMEERVRQLNWATITDRLAAIRLGLMSGFRLPSGTPATLSGTFSLASGVATVRIPIPEGVQVITKEVGSKKRYRVTSTGAAIEVGASSVTVNLEQAEVVDEDFDSSLEPNMELLLGKEPYVDQSAVVTANDGSYTEYLTFLGADSAARAFVVLVDDESRARIRFGNGLNGSIPQGSINVQYKVGGGTAGEVSANASWAIEDTITDEIGSPKVLLFTNSVSSQSGTDAMSVSEARVRGPQSLRTRERQVNEGDFEYIATSVPGIARAFLATSDTSSIIAEDTARLELVAFGTKLPSGRYQAASPSAAKIAEVNAGVQKYSDKPPVMGFTVTTVAATLSSINVTVRIHKTSDAVAADVSVAIRAALDDFFAAALDDRTPNPNIDFGARLLGSDGEPDYLILWSAVFEAILTAEGVRHISPASNELLLNGSRGSVLLQPRSFPQLGSVIIYDDDNGGQQI